MKKLLGIGIVGIGALSITVIAGIALVIMLIVSMIASDEEVAASESSISDGLFCSPTKEIDTTTWNNAFKNAGVLADKGDKFISVAKEQGIDPVLFAAISFHESAYGKSKPAKDKNNIGGLMSSNGLYVYSTLDEGIEAMGRTLHNRIIVDGKNTIELLGSVYAPLGASNDPNNLNANWIPTVTKIVTDLGGLTMNCEASEGITTDFDFSKLNESTASELRKKVATTGMKWLGRPYRWGRGRTPADVAAGLFDCSSFVRWVFNENGINLGPMGATSTETLNKIGKKISIKDIKIGDVIFFDTVKKDGHIVIYIGDGKFIGANGDDKSGSISIQNLSAPYWKSTFTGHVRRYIND